MKRLFAVSFISLFALGALTLAQGRFTIDDMMKVRRVSDSQVSPDGRMAEFVIGDVKFDDNRVVSQIYSAPISGGDPKQLTSGSASASSPRWSPDGKKIAYVTGGQIWAMDADGSDKEQVTKISTGAGGPVWSDDGKWIAFSSDVYPDCSDDACNKRKEDAAEKNKVKAHITDRLLYRHWNEWRDIKRTHVFVVSSKGGTALELTPGDADAPPYAVAGDVDYSFSPDSKELAFLRNPDKVEATSTNSDVYVVSTTGGPARNITARNRGYEDSPVYTSDGKSIIYRSQATTGFEADRWRLMSYDRGSGVSRELLPGFDLSVDDVVLAPDGSSIYITAGERGRGHIYKVPVNGGTPQKILGGVFASNLQITSDGRTLVFVNSSLSSPPEIYRAGADGSGLAAVTRVNPDFMTRSDLKAAEEIEWSGALGAKVHGFLLKPRNFDAAKRYPLVVLIHGGPQGAWNDSWSTRWNPQVFTDAGYVVFMPNPRGSTGYGQQFTNEISGDWGGKAFIDLKNGVADVLRRNSYIDRSRIGAAGGSYGGHT